MRSVQARAFFVACLAVVSAMPAKAETSGSSRAGPTRAQPLPPVVDKTCGGLLCDLIPETMTPPLTAARLAEIEAAVRSRPLPKPTKGKTRARRPSVMVASAGKGVEVSYNPQGPAGEPRLAAQTPIFSLTDPVIAPADYSRWLYRVPRSSQARAVALDMKRPT